MTTPRPYSSVEEALIAGVVFTAVRIDEGRPLFRWIFETDDLELECSMGFDHMLECAKDALTEIAHAKEQAVEDDYRSRAIF